IRHRGKMTEMTICPNCQQETPARRSKCRHCGTTINFDLNKWLADPKVYGEVVRYIVIGLAILALLVALLPTLAIEIKIGVALLCVAVALMLMWRNTQTM